MTEHLQPDNKQPDRSLPTPPKSGPYKLGVNAIEQKEQCPDGLRSECAGSAARMTYDCTSSVRAGDVSRRSGHLGTALQTSVYLHFPWCLKKCPYCDFATTQVNHREIPEEKYADAVLRELELRAPSLGERHLYSIFLGGGTPSLWSPTQIKRVLKAVRKAFASENQALEVTLECNPSSFAAKQIEAFCDAGINRFSFGVQSLDDEVLRFLGRDHDASAAIRCVESASRLGVRVSADLIFGVPGLEKQSLQEDLLQLRAAGAKHISAYALTIEENTRFGTLAREGKFPLSSEESYAEQFETIEMAMEDMGFLHYEVSNYAMPGEIALHNLHYWRGGDYLGLGVSAVGKLRGHKGSRRSQNQRLIKPYLEAKTLEDFEQEEELLSESELRTERLMLGLRTYEGVTVEELQGTSRDTSLREIPKRIECAFERGFLQEEGNRIVIPKRHWLLLDGIIAGLI